MSQLNSCLFCRIARHEIPSQVAWEDDVFIAFADIHPKARVHLLIIPKDHVLPSTAEMQPEHDLLIGEMVRRAKLLAEELGIADSGYRLVFNTRKHAGQEVDHIHLHLIGGQTIQGMA